MRCKSLVISRWGITDRKSEQTDGVLVKSDLLHELFGEGKQLLFGEQEIGGGDGTGDLCEVVKFHLQRECITLELCAVETVKQFEQDVIKFNGDGSRGGKVVLIGALTAHRFAYPISHHGTIVNAACKVVEQ